MTRPWQSQVPRLPEAVTEKVLFPTDEESDGLARIAWRGPSALVSVRVTPATLFSLHDSSPCHTLLCV